MNKLYIMVGVPGSGKSTWIKNQNWALGMNVASTDVWVELYAKLKGKTYSEVFEEYMPTAVEKMAEHVVWCRDNKLDLIWDQTSTTIKTRAKKIRMLPEYYKIAVVVKTPPADELMVRLASRPGKLIPLDVVANMVEQLKAEPPTIEEGFDEIWYAE